MSVIFVNNNSAFWSSTMKLKYLVLMLSVLSWTKGCENESNNAKVLGNFEPRDLPKRTGPGEEGEAYNLPPEKKNLAEDSEMEYGMNIACSNEISMHRSVRDTRLEECMHWDYPYDLPKTSVIIVFHNEGFSVLMRTVHSVIDRSPKHILHEILLVDDFSDKPDLKDKLDTYLEQFSGLVRLIRNTEREGLVQTRSRIAKEATGEVIVFLDGHCEVNINWLPPLLAPIYRDRTVMTVPIIDKVDHKTFEYHSVHDNDHLYRGTFDWDMLYKEVKLPEREKKRRAHNSEPYHSPTHAGDVFAINREYFLELGAYDPGLYGCGGHNLELSFKVWQCGGGIEWVPCSRVGHVFRRRLMPDKLGKLVEQSEKAVTAINHKRIIETWFDDSYKEYFYRKVPLAIYLEMGDINDQLALKDRFKCKSFQWFMNNVVYEDVSDEFTDLPANLRWGELRSITGNNCVDSMNLEPPVIMRMYSCHGAGMSQFIRLNASGQLGLGEYCIVGDTQGVKLAVCREGVIDGPWQYNEETKHLLHRVNKRCMTLYPRTSELMLRLCEVDNVNQHFQFNPIKPRW